MTSKKHEDREQNLKTANYFADIFGANIYRISRFLVSKKPKYEAILIFDGVTFILTEYVIYLLGRIKIFNQGGFRFIWLFGVALLAPILICGLIGIFRQKHAKPKNKTIEVRIAEEEDFKDDPNLPHFSQAEINKLLREHPELSVKEK